MPRESTPGLEREQMQAWFYTSVEQTVTDILVAVTKGKISIHVGRGSGGFDGLSRLFSVSYWRLFERDSTFNEWCVCSIYRFIALPWSCFENYT